tara:strand:- start:12070 stop:13017 length:948 start_codon:yes stop_codon:yes gene_type:complete
MNIYNFLKKVLIRFYYVLYFNPKKKFYRKLSFYSVHKNPSFLRMSSNPYVSGDTFRNYSEHIFDETRSINPKKIKKGETIFLKTELKEIFFSEFHNKIKEPYILITHNSDQSIGEQDLGFIDEKIIHWFAMKLNVNMDNRISPIPAGLENYRYLNNGIINNFTKVLKTRDENMKDRKVLCSFNPSTNKYEREPLINISETVDNIDIKNFANNIDYLNHLSNYQYNLCPEGNDFESHRLWETLFFNNLPIVKENKLNKNFSKLGVPIVMLKSWELLLEKDLFLTLENCLHNKESEPNKYVEFEFWKSRIEKYRSLS